MVPKLRSRSLSARANTPSVSPTMTRCSISDPPLNKIFLILPNQGDFYEAYPERGLMCGCLLSPVSNLDHKSEVQTQPFRVWTSLLS